MSVTLVSPLRQLIVCVRRVKVGTEVVLNANRLQIFRQTRVGHKQSRKTFRPATPSLSTERDNIARKRTLELHILSISQGPREGPTGRGSVPRC